VEYVAMSPKPETPETPSADRGVFGNLPSERPGVRSPRRQGDKDSAAGKAKQAKSAPAKQAARPRPQPRKPSPPPPREPARGPEPSEPGPSATPPEEEASSRGGIEEVAWAGVTVAAEAATLGVRLFSRALEAVRERR
jgi:hypothetical protein